MLRPLFVFLEKPSMFLGVSLLRLALFKEVMSQFRASVGKICFSSFPGFEVLI